MPAGWSSGAASAGTVIVKGTTRVSPASTVTSGCTVIHVPPSTERRADGSMLKRPSLVR